MPGFTGTGEGPANEAQKLFRKSQLISSVVHNFCVKDCGAGEYAFEEFDVSGNVVDWFCVASSECPIINNNNFTSGVNQNTNPELYFLTYQVNSKLVCTKDCPSSQHYYKYTGGSGSAPY
jgi:hypothetical protein